jgi:hypothetical protein
MHEQERHARALSRAFSQEFAPTDTQVSVEGAGVHWTCAVAREGRACSVSCFDARGPEYLASFKHGDRTEAWGRTPSKADVVAAVARWMAGDAVEGLHARFAFVDRQKRALSALASEAVQSHLELARSATHEVRHLGSDLNDLWFRAGDRSCRVCYYGDNAFPDAYFHWDGCEMFRFRADNTTRLGSVLKWWLCDRAMPSRMESDFPWLRLEPVARYYEEGRPVEGEFVASWDAIEQFYAPTNYPLATPVLALITAIRRAGYDKTLRAGQSLWTLMVSRSRRHGLRKGQPHIAFEFHRGGMDVSVNMRDREKHSFPGIEFTPQVDALLRRLVTEDIG